MATEEKSKYDRLSSWRGCGSWGLQAVYQYCSACEMQGKGHRGSCLKNLLKKTNIAKRFVIAACLRAPHRQVKTGIWTLWIDSVSSMMTKKRGQCNDKQRNRKEFFNNLSRVDPYCCCFKNLSISVTLIPQS